tara:strand:- start:1481 stop:3340 length:1860 start_codon:yes stop_codon:yes gene_type:complete
MAEKVLSKEDIQKLAAQADNTQGLAPEALKRLASAKADKEKLAKEIMDKMNAVKKNAEAFKKAALKQYKNEIVGITILPPKPAKNGERTEPELLVLLAIEEEDFSKLLKKKNEIAKKLESLRSGPIKNTNTNYLALAEVWDACEKGKYEILNLITIGLPVYDNGWVTATRSVEMHKAQVIQKFEKYVICYVLAGSVLRGEASEGSDLDTFIVIDDTDVTRMTAAELKSKLASIIYGMAAQASMQAGGKYKIHPQIYLLTDMWNSINLAHPVIFTLIREGVPLYDRGMFMPWKMLLRKGQVKSTPEAIKGYIKSGKQAIERVKRKLKDIAMEDLFYAASIPAQGALMLEGREPPVPWHTPEEFTKYFVKNRKLMSAKDAEILTTNLKLRKAFEHGKKEEVDPAEVVANLKASETFLKKIEKLFEKLQKEKVVNESKLLYERTVDDIEAALSLVGSKIKSVHSGLKSEIVANGLASVRFLALFKEVEAANKDHNISREKLASLSFEEEKLANEMFERIRSSRGGKLEKFKVSVSYGKGKVAGVWMLGSEAYVVIDANDPRTKMKHFKIGKDGALTDGKSASLDAINKALKQFSGKPATLTDAGIASIKKILGKDAKIIVGA